MKLIHLIIISFLITCGLGITLTSCGTSQHDNETVAYVKHVTNASPLFCPNRTDAELDMRTPGTMTSERVRFTVLNKADAETLRTANKMSAKVKIISDELRFVFCGQEDVITKVEILKDVPNPTVDVK